MSLTFCHNCLKLKWSRVFFRNEQNWIFYIQSSMPSSVLITLSLLTTDWRVIPLCLFGNTRNLHTANPFSVSPENIATTKKKQFGKIANKMEKKKGPENQSQEPAVPWTAFPESFFSVILKKLPRSFFSQHTGLLSFLSTLTEIPRRKNQSKINDAKKANELFKTSDWGKAAASVGE